MRTILATALLTAISVAPASALAAARVAVLPFAPLAGDVPQGAGEKGADILLKELKGQSDFEVVARDTAQSTAAADALIKARAKLAEARAQVAAHKGAAAAQAYREAIATFGVSLPELDSFDEVVAAQGELGVLLYRLGQDDQGQKALAEAVRLSAGQVPKPVAASPTFAAQAEALTKALAKLGKGSMRIDSLPEGAEVFVDGQSAGKTPVELRDLPEGTHYLRAILPSGEKWGQVANAVAKQEPKLRAASGAAGPAADVLGQLAENKLDAQLPGTLKAVAGNDKVAFLIFGSLHRTPNGLALDPFLYNADKGKVSRLKRVAFDTEMLEAGLQMDKVVSEVQGLLAGDATPFPLPVKASPDVQAERELATEFHFGGTPDAVGDQTQPATTPTSEEPSGGGGSRVLHRRANPEPE